MPPGHDNDGDAAASKAMALDLIVRRMVNDERVVGNRYNPLARPATQLAVSLGGAEYRRHRAQLQRAHRIDQLSHELPVHAFKGSLPNVEAALAEGARTHYPRHNIGLGGTALQQAAKARHPLVVKRLLEAGANHGTIKGDKKGFTPLHYAADAQSLAVARELLARANVNARNFNGKTPLHRAMRSSEVNHNGSMARALLHAGAHVNAQDRQGHTPLHTGAMRYGPAPSIHALLAAGANVHAATDHGKTPLHLAAASGYAERTQMLLNAGASVHATDHKGRTPLHTTAQHPDNVLNGVDNVTSLLLQRGARVDAPNAAGRTPLHAAAYHASPGSRADALLAAGADPGTRDRQGHTPLYSAVSNPEVPRSRRPTQMAIVNALLAHGANLRAATETGNTPLHAAARLGRHDLVYHLLAAGADPGIRNRQGHTPLDTARVAYLVQRLKGTSRRNVFSTYHVKANYPRTIRELKLGS